MERACKWHFKEEGGRDIGPNDPIDEKFKGQPYYSIVREAIQNSLDAVHDESNPVQVDFDFFELDRSEFPNFFAIEENIRQCAKYYQKNENAELLFKNMLHGLNGDQPGKKKLRLSCLRISDHNTKGMPYDSSDTRSPFYAFLRAGGVSAHKGHNSGGSFGFGKGAYFTLSAIKSIIVSTRDESGNVFFEGSSILTTHKDDSGKKLTAYGYYDNNGGNPVTTQESIPEVFRRTTVGTDVNIIGLWDEPERKKLMVKSVLNNFWFAIHSSKLQVRVQDISISHDNLEQVIDQYFASELESGNATDVEAWNPKSYFKAVKYARASDQYLLFQEELETLGLVSFYVYLERGLPNRTAFFRKPKMVVFKRTNRKVNGYSAVFICESDKGNAILRQMENPAHNEWRKENFPKDEGKIDKIARRAENEFSDFVNGKLDSLSKVNTSKKVAFLGLEDYLSIPEDLLEKDEGLELSGESDALSGSGSHELANHETGLQTTTVNSPVLIKPIVATNNSITAPLETNENDGSVSTLAGGNNNSEGGDTPGNDDGDNVGSGEEGSGQAHRRSLIKVSFKVAAQVENNVVYHNLLFRTDAEVVKAEIEVMSAVDNDRDEKLKIESVTQGSAKGNKIVGLSLQKGINRIKVRFEDNMKHAIRLKAYEIH